MSFIKQGELIGISSDKMKSDNGKTGLGLLGERELLGQRGLHFPPPPIDKEWLKKNALTYEVVMKTSSGIPKKERF